MQLNKRVPCKKCRHEIERGRDFCSKCLTDLILESRAKDNKL